MSEYILKDGHIIRTKDDKIIAAIKDGKVVPVAPVYYKILTTLEAVAKGGGDTRPSSDDGEATGTQRPDAPKLVVTPKAKKVTHGDAGPEPVQSNRFGRCTHGYPTWLHATDPELAAKIYRGTGLKEYEDLIKK